MKLQNKVQKKPHLCLYPLNLSPLTFRVSFLAPAADSVHCIIICKQLPKSLHYINSIEKSFYVAWSLFLRFVFKEHTIHFTILDFLFCCSLFFLYNFQLSTFLVNSKLHSCLICYELSKVSTKLTKKCQECPFKLLLLSLLCTVNSQLKTRFHFRYYKTVFLDVQIIVSWLNGFPCGYKNLLVRDRLKVWS